ncbi:thiamine pyrophosphate-binding protein [Streptomyces tubercidicus]|uniref:thiamine pyrophosphate-binding protein n=1 Tax=Streptomyces tubercidicus TaxID=47759 RepID=UPI0037A5E109
MAQQTIAEQYVDLMARAGVRRVYGVVGDSLNPVVDAVRRHDAVEWVQVRHEAFAHDGPALVDVVTDPAALAVPPKITTEQISGFALSASRTVLSVGVGRMVHLARANLRNIPRP